jgi:hypothetical protein
MSGTAALAAARRRRAQPSGEDLPKSRPNSAANTPVPPTAPTPTTPIQVLIKHDNKINELVVDVEQLKDIIKQKDNTNPNDIEYYKTQYSNLTHEVAELKKLIMKVQSFSMENNMEIIQLKKATRQERDKTENTDFLEEPNAI